MIEIAALYEIYKKNPVVYIDNRKVDGPGLFFGLKGDRHDGNTYADDALKAGATFAIIDNDHYTSNERCILVENSLETLQELARYHRSQLDIPVIGITGTNGKTTTKELLAQVLCVKYQIHTTPGNYNNHIGLPLTILSCPHTAELLLLEMGASKKGDIKELCEIATPTHGLITNIGRAHLEGFGNAGEIFITKKELYDFIVKANGQFFINLDESSLQKLVSSYPGLVNYGSIGDPDFPMTYSLNGMNAQVKFSTKNESFLCDSNLFGLYNGYNIAAAITIGLYFDIDAGKIKDAIETYHPDNNRSQIIHKGELSIILDCYNANPTSMLKAIEAFAQFDYPIKSLILGDMLELGEYTAEEHQTIVDEIKKYKWAEVILVGPLFEQSKKHNYIEVPSADQIEFTSVKDGWVLIKGSRGMALEQLVRDSEV